MGFSNVTNNAINLYANTELSIENAKECITLWSEFGDIPMNQETEEIEQEWNGFSIGTHREEIWHWFEERFDISVTDLMYK